MAEMNVRGILRKTSSPPKKRNLSTRIPDDNLGHKTVAIINHNRNDNENRSMNIPIDRVYSHSVDEKLSKERYTTPEFYSSLAIAKNIEQLNNLRYNHIMDMKQLTPKTKALVTEKAVKKLNIGPNKTIYKQLAPINVNDSVLEILPRPKRLNRECTSTAQPEPILKNYLRPSKRLEYTMPDIDYGSDPRPKMKDFVKEHFVEMCERIPRLSQPPYYIKSPEPLSTNGM